MKPSSARLTGGCWSPARISGTRHVVAGVQLEYQVKGMWLLESSQNIRYTADQWLLESSQNIRYKACGCWIPAKISGTRLTSGAGVQLEYLIQGTWLLESSQIMRYKAVVVGVQLEYLIQGMWLLESSQNIRYKAVVVGVQLEQHVQASG